MSYDFSQDPYGRRPPPSNMSLGYMAFEPAAQRGWTTTDGASTQPYTLDRASLTSGGEGEKKTRSANPCGPCKKHRVKCRVERPCDTCTSNGRQCTTGLTGQAIRTGPAPAGIKVKTDPEIRDADDLRRFDGATWEIPPNFSDLAAQHPSTSFDQRSRSLPDTQTVPSNESTPPSAQQRLSGSQPWPPSPTYGAGTVGGAGSSVREEYRELPSTLLPGADDPFFAIPPVGHLVPPHPRFFADGTLPPINSFDDFVPGDGDDIRGC